MAFKASKAHEATMAQLVRWDNLGVLVLVVSKVCLVLALLDHPDLQAPGEMSD